MYCTKEDLDEIQGKKKKEDCVASYIACVGYYQQCLDSGQCNSSDPSFAGGAEGFCSSTLFMCSTGSQL